MILSGLLTRDEALKLLETSNYPEELRKQDHEFIAKKLGVTVAELEELIARPPVNYDAYPNSEAFWEFVRKASSPFSASARRAGLLQ
jgi:hypothetical protein